MAFTAFVRHLTREKRRDSMRAKLFLLGVTLSATPLTAQSSEAPFVVRARNQAFGSLQDAVNAIGGGTGTIVIAPGTYRDCAVQEAGRVTFEAAQPGSVIFDGGICQEKATLVLGGRSAKVAGVIFENLRVADGNGAGIRLEGGDLIVMNTMFRNSESGILSGDDRKSSIRVEHSTFAGLGRCDRGLDCAHSIYIGEYGSLSVVRTRFEQGRGGHYVKSRAPRIEVLESSFDDTAGTATNYMIDLSAGATGTIARNIFVQGKDKENYSAFIMVAAEGDTNSSDGLNVADNEATIAPGVRRDTSFVADASGDRIQVANNRLGAAIARFEKR
jgi:hypothetical protein